jgi:hypothetical protein
MGTTKGFVFPSTKRKLKLWKTSKTLRQNAKKIGISYWDAAQLSHRWGLKHKNEHTHSKGRPIKPLWRGRGK